MYGITKEYLTTYTATRKSNKMAVKKKPAMKKKGMARGGAMSKMKMKKKGMAKGGKMKKGYAKGGAMMMMKKKPAAKKKK